MSFDSDKLEDLKLTPEEVDRFTNALKNEEFKKMFFEYAQEISDPENRARYEMEIRQMENDRGMDVKFINPVPGYVIKTTVNGKTKAFINICSNEHIGKPTSVKKLDSEGRPGLSWSLPHSFTPPREDLDKDKNKCQVYDFVVHPDTYRMGETNSRFRKMINDLALEGVSKQFDVELDVKNVKFPKIKYKGAPSQTVIRSRLSEHQQQPKEKDSDDIMDHFPYPYDNKTTEEKAKLHEEEMRRKAEEKKKMQGKTTKSSQIADNGEPTHAVPYYRIKHRSDIDMQDYVDSPDIARTAWPTALIVEINLPLLSSASSVQLDVFEKKIKLLSDQPAKYKLELDLPYPVDENQGSAKFDKAARKLVVTLIVVRQRIQDSLNQTISEMFSGGHVADSEADMETHLSATTEKPLIQTVTMYYHKLGSEIISSCLKLVSKDLTMQHLVLGNLPTTFHVPSSTEKEIDDCTPAVPEMQLNADPSGSLATDATTTNAGESNCLTAECELEVRNPEGNHVNPVTDSAEVSPDVGAETERQSSQSENCSDNFHAAVQSSSRQNFGSNCDDQSQSDAGNVQQLNGNGNCSFDSDDEPADDVDRIRGRHLEQVSVAADDLSVLKSADCESLDGVPSDEVVNRDDWCQGSDVADLTDAGRAKSPGIGGVASKPADGDISLSAVSGSDTQDPVKRDKVSSDVVSGDDATVPNDTVETVPESSDESAHLVNVKATDSSGDVPKPVNSANNNQLKSNGESKSETTVLNWDEGIRTKSKCAVNLTNSSIYDLDVD